MNYSPYGIYPNYSSKRKWYFKNDIVKFGKYKNIKIYDIPTDYIQWAMREFTKPSYYWSSRGFKPVASVAEKMRTELQRRELEMEAKVKEQKEKEQKIIDKFVEENGLAKYLSKKDTKFNVGDWVVVKKYAKRKGIVKDEASIGEITFAGIENGKAYYHVDTGLVMSSGVYYDEDLKVRNEKPSIFTAGSILLLWMIFLFSPLPVLTYIALYMKG